MKGQNLPPESVSPQTPPLGKRDTASAEAATQMGPAALFQPGMIAMQMAAPVRVAPNLAVAGTEAAGAGVASRGPTLILAGLAFVVLIGAGAIFGAPLLRAPQSPKAAAGSEPAGASQGTESSAAAVSAAPDSEYGRACLQDSSQVITSERRDGLLLDAIQAYADGKYDSAKRNLQEYTQEACDRATFEALRILDQRIAVPNKEP